MIRTGVTRCDKCHGDPDGQRPPDRARPGRPRLHATVAPRVRLVPRRRRLGEPLHGEPRSRCRRRRTTAPARSATARPAGRCNPATAHVHPINDPAVNPGINFDVTEPGPRPGTNNGDGKIQPGEKVAGHVRHARRRRQPGHAGRLGRRWAAASTSRSPGPTTNRQPAAEHEPPARRDHGERAVHDSRSPRSCMLEYVGDSTGSARDVHDLADATLGGRRRARRRVDRPDGERRLGDGREPDPRRVRTTSTSCPGSAPTR